MAAPRSNMTPGFLARMSQALTPARGFAMRRSEVNVQHSTVNTPGRDQYITVTNVNYAGQGLLESNIQSSPRDQTINVYFDIPLDTNKNYVERPKLDAELERLLPTPARGPSLTRRVVLHGLGGSGKTEMAVRFAERHRANYFAVFWINGTDEARISDSFHAIAQVLGMGSNAGSPESPEVALRRVRTWLSTNNLWLLIIDNLDDDAAMDVVQRKYISTGMNGDILITSRNRNAIARWNSIEVSDMEPQEATALLRRIAGARMADESECLGLSQDLGYLPLALDQASSFILQTGISVTRYRQLFAIEKCRLLEHFPSTQYNQEYRQNVMTTWKISFDRVERDDPQAAKLLLILSLLDFEDIPREILESAVKGQCYWAENGEFEDVPEAEHWIPDDLLTMFKSELRLIEATAALTKFSFLRQRQCQRIAPSFRMHPLVNFWASQRLADSPEIKQQLTICVIGLVAGSFVQHDCLPPLHGRSQWARGPDERNLGIWPLRRYSHLTLHAHRCLRYATTIDNMPESVALLALSLLQVLEYSTFCPTSSKGDQDISLSLINHVAKFETATDLYLPYCVITWRLARADLCWCRIKHLHVGRVWVRDEQTESGRGFICDDCLFAYSEAKRLLGEACYNVSPRMIALHQSLQFRLKSDMCWRVCFPTQSQLSAHNASDVAAVEGDTQPDPLEFKIRGPAYDSDRILGCSSLEKYESATRQYQTIRFDAEYGKLLDTKMCMDVADTFKLLCGPSSEEYRRSLFYATSAMMHNPSDTDNVSKLLLWQKIEAMLQPLVECSIQTPMHSWSHERCIIRYTESLLKQKKVLKAKEVMRRLKVAYSPTGEQLQAVRSSPLMQHQGVSENIVSKDIQIFIKTLTGRTITVNTNTCATLHGVFDQYVARECMPKSDFRLIYAGKQLEPNRFLSDYNIQGGETLHLVLRLSGGVEKCLV